jgi:uncharacterized protein involved in cysteine biosynthesis
MVKIERPVDKFFHRFDQFPAYTHKINFEEKSQFASITGVLCSIFFFVILLTASVPLVIKLLTGRNP